MNRITSPPTCLGILGLSRSGIAAARLARAQGLACWLSEFNELTDASRPFAQELESLGVRLERGGHSEEFLNTVDLVVASPGIPPLASIFQKLAQQNTPVVSELDLGFWANEARETTPIAAITGTNGKTSTASLLGAMAAQHQWQVPVCGNIGLPFSDAVRTTPNANAYVVEVSSYQLHTSQAFQPKVAVYLNLTPDHLTWHGNQAAYESAKAKLFLPPLAPEWAVMNWDDPVCRALIDTTPANVIAFSLDNAPIEHPKVTGRLQVINGDIVANFPGESPKTLLSTDSLVLPGCHNQANTMAAMGVAWPLGISSDAMVNAAINFSGVEHRMEYVATLNHCRIYNDSKATNPEAAIPAISAFAPNKIVLIAGGQDKLTSLVSFSDAVKEHVDTIILYGEASQRFSEALQSFQSNDTFNIVTTTTLSEACDVALRVANAQPIVLSPACASFDQFRDFEARGEYFKAIIRSLNATTTNVTSSATT